MGAGAYDITVELGSDWTRTVSFTVKATSAPIDFTGAAATWGFYLEGSDTPFYTALSTGGSPAIVIAGTAGTLTLTLPTTVTATWPSIGRAEHRLTITDASGFRRRYLQGRVFTS